MYSLLCMNNCLNVLDYLNHRCKISVSWCPCRVLDMQVCLVLKDTLVLLDPKVFQGMSVLKAMVLQALKGNSDPKEIMEFLGLRDILDNQDLQVRHLKQRFLSGVHLPTCHEFCLSLLSLGHQVKLNNAVMKLSLDHLDIRVNQVHQVRHTAFTNDISDDADWIR